MTMEPERPLGTLVRLWGALLVTVGAIVAATCGGCTALFVFAILADAVSRGNTGDLGMLVLSLLGLIPTVIGLLLFRAGMARLRRSSEAASDE